MHLVTQELMSHKSIPEVSQIASRLHIVAASQQPVILRIDGSGQFPAQSKKTAYKMRVAQETTSCSSDLMNSVAAIEIG